MWSIVVFFLQMKQIGGEEGSDTQQQEVGLDWSVYRRERKGWPLGIGHKGCHLGCPSSFLLFFIVNDNNYNYTNLYFNHFDN